MFSRQPSEGAQQRWRSFQKTRGQGKGAWYETARNLFRSRNAQHARAEQLAEENRQLREANEQLQQESREREEELARTQQLLKQHQQENEQLKTQPLTLPSDLPLKHHSFGPKMISLCLNLAKQIGFRPTETALKIVFDWLGVEANVPSFDSIRTWACRAGVAQLQSIQRDDQPWIWMADHSNQIGQEKLLQIIGIRTKDLPPIGETLPREKMVVLATVPGTSWSREDVRREYKKLAERMGSPAFLLTDGAVELIESADVLQIEGTSPVVLRDFKHFAANVLEKLIGKDERFKAYLSKLAQTRSAVQQTELSHFTPPPQKPKSRFMNLGPTLRWGQMVSSHLSDCHTQSRQGVTAERMNEKLAWLRGFRKDLAAWSRCQEVLQASLRFINRQGVYQGAAAKLQNAFDQLRATHSQDCELSATLASKLIAFVEESESRLPTGERAWLSTENLESLFGQYKRLEGQHSKGGFTSLVAALPMLPTHWTPEQVRTRLSAVTVKKMRQWTHETLGRTLCSKRATAYKESRKTTGQQKN